MVNLGVLRAVEQHRAPPACCLNVEYAIKRRAVYAGAPGRHNATRVHCSPGVTVRSTGSFPASPSARMTLPSNGGDSVS